MDASPFCIGAVLLQNEQPIANSSTPLIVSQKRYFQIKKQFLAVQFGLMRLRQYVYGQLVVVKSDHKPLVGLLDKPLASCSPSIQRMRLQLQRSNAHLNQSRKPTMSRGFTKGTSFEGQSAILGKSTDATTSVKLKK